MQHGSILRDGALVHHTGDGLDGRATVSPLLGRDAVATPPGDETLYVTGPDLRHLRVAQRLDEVDAERFEGVTVGRLGAGSLPRQLIPFVLGEQPRETDAGDKAQLLPLVLVLQLGPLRFGELLGRALLSRAHGERMALATDAQAQLPAAAVAAQASGVTGHGPTPSQAGRGWPAQSVSERGCRASARTGAAVGAPASGAGRRA